MAVSEQRVLPPEFIEAAGKTYLDDLSKATGQFKDADLSKVFGSQFVAGLDPIQQEAQALRGGLGSFLPFLQTAATEAGKASQFMGPQAYQQFMSPFQKDVIDTTLQEFDRQAQRGITSIADQAIASGAFGGGREGVQRAEYMASSDRNRAALQAQLLGQAFGQAQQAAAQNFGQQMNLAQAAPALAGQQISALTTLGGIQQGQAQADLSAQQQLLQQQLNQPLQATQALGSGITSLIAGYPGGTTTQMSPSPTPLQTALGAGATLAGIYRAFS